MSAGHSDLKTSAPVREPSPPHTASASIPSLIRLYAAIRRPSGVRNACERAVPMSVPPYSYISPPRRRFKWHLEKKGPRRAYLSKPAAHIVPSNAHDVAPLERPSAGVVARPITQKSTISKAQVLDERGIADLDVERLELVRTRGFRVYVPAN